MTTQGVFDYPNPYIPTTIRTGYSDKVGYPNGSPEFILTLDDLGYTCVSIPEVTLTMPPPFTINHKDS